MYSKILIMPYTNSLSECIVELQLLIDKADYQLVGAGAGLSPIQGWRMPEKTFRRSANHG